MKRTTIPVAALAYAGSVGLAGARADERPTIERGRQGYMEQRCKACHSIAGIGNKRHPLDDIGSRLTAEEIRKWIVAPREMDPKVRKMAYDKLPKTDLDALAAYLRSLKKT